MSDCIEQPNLQYFNDAQYYALAMNTRDEVIVAGRGVGKGAIQARRLQSCFQGMPGSMGGFVAPSVKRCLTNILPSMLIHLERWGFKRDLHYVVGRRPWKKLHWKSPRSFFHRCRRTSRRCPSRQSRRQTPVRRNLFQQSKYS